MADKVKIVINGQVIELPKESITQGIEKGEVTITDENILMFKKEEYETRTKNIEKESYNKGKKDGVEIEWKETKRKLGIDIEGKNGDEIIDAYRVKILADAKVEPNEKIKEHEKTIGQLRVNLTKAETEKNELQISFQKKEKDMKISSILYNTIPDKAVNETFTKNDIISLYKSNGFGVDISDGKEVATFNGEIVKDDKTLEPLSVKTVVEKFVNDKGLIKKEPGRDDKDKVLIKDQKNTLDAFEKEMKEKGIKYNSPEYISEMKSRIKDKTLIV